MGATSEPFAVDQELVAYLFAVTDGPDAAKARDAVDRIRGRAERVLRLHAPIDPVGRVPDNVLDARQSPGAACQLLVRREPDLLVLSLLITNPDSGAEPSGWTGLDTLMDEVLGEDAGSLLGAARLYLAKTGDQAENQTDAKTGAFAGDRTADLTTELRDRVAGELPTARQEPGWWDVAPTIVERLLAWDLRPHAVGRSDRAILILAPPGGDTALSVWAWSDGSHRLAPFARYLEHAAKIDYQMRVHQAAMPAGELCRRIEDAILARQAGCLEDVATEDTARGDSNAGQVDPGRSAPTLSELGMRAATRIALLKSMDRTVEIAGANAAAALRIGRPAADGLVEEDAAAWQWFRQRIGDDIAYLENAYEAVRRLGDAATAGSIATATPTTATTASLAAAVVVRPPVREPDTEPVLGLVTAMPEEFVAMAAMVDGSVRENVVGDRSNYVLGTMPSADPRHRHRVVLTMLGDTGNDAAAAACTQLAASFPSVSAVMMVGIAAGVPDPARPDRHVRLGDIVVSTWGIVDYDHVVDRPGERLPRQPFPRPSRLLAHPANWLAAQEMLGVRPWEERLDSVVAAGLTDFARPPDDTDVLFLEDGARRPARHPDPAVSGHRQGWPKVHHGHIGSADRALRNAASRDELAAKYDLRALEMEGKGVANAGFANGLEWLVVRGISDYGDTHTDKRWRKYAALTAAAYTWALLGVCAPFTARGGHTRAVRSDDARV